MIHPAFWRDKRLGRMPAEHVLTFVGLWMLSDDSGWSRFDVDEMAAELFPYQPSKTRETLFRAAVAALIENGRLQVFDCGHAFVSNLAIYQKPGHPIYATRQEHLASCSHPRPIAVNSSE